VASSTDALIFASARDVTQSKAAEAALEASERQTREILETAHDAFISFDAGGVITAWNPQAEAVFGWSRAEVLGRLFSATIVPADRRAGHRRRIERFLETGDDEVVGRTLERTVIHRDGHVFASELTITPLATAQGYSFNVFLRDITERRREQEALALARDQALEASRMKSMFVTNVGHEIRTPMNGVIGMTELLLGTGLDDEQREYAETIAASGEALLAIIDDVLDLSEVEAGTLELEPTEFDLIDTIERACGMLAARAADKDLELVVGIAPGVPARVRGDAGRLGQVIVILISNAIKFTPAGEVVVRASARPAADGRVCVRVEVEDTGIGIAPPVLERLFEPFSQADGSMTRTYGGTGLGLAMSKHLIELMGGRVGAESETGQGSSFWFEVPLTPVAGVEAGPDEELAGTRVLVVGANPSAAEVLEATLSSWGVRCDVVADGAEALEWSESAAARGAPYGVALICSPRAGGAGYELAQTIRRTASLRAIRLVLVTAAGVRADIPDAFDGVLTKPVRQSRLRAQLLRVAAAGHPAEPAADGPAAQAGDPRPGTAARILVVEDTPVNQVVVARMLQKHGFEVRLAANGRVALEVFGQASFDAVLMDCQMPELDGYETTREIRRIEGDGPHVPIIAMTANSMHGERERCLAAGMDDFLTKPLRDRTLRETVGRWVSRVTAAGGIPPPDVVEPALGTDAPALVDARRIAALDELDSGC
jgi:PAS domain S-box-containing protein